MLSKQAFIAGIAVIKKAFIGWQFDLNDMVQVNLWYSAFANLTDNQFTGLINEYIKNNKQPPMSIKALTDVFVDRQIKLAKMPPEKAFSYVRELISDCGGWEYGGKSEPKGRSLRFAFVTMCRRAAEWSGHGEDFRHRRHGCW